MLYPVSLNIAHRLCLVVGGGAVALRKIRGLLAAGAAVRVVSPQVAPTLKELAHLQEIEWLERNFVGGDLRGAFLAFAATNDPEIQALVREEATRYSVLLDSVDDPSNSHFHVPAHFRRGKMLVTVSTGGESPALAKRIRQQLEKEIVPGYEYVVEILTLIRDVMLSQNDVGLSHRTVLHGLLRQEIVALVLEKRWSELRIMLLQELPRTVDAVAIMEQFLEKYEELTAS